MTTIGFIGSGNIGGTVAKLATDAGYEVVMSNSRGPETLTELVESLGDAARAGTTEEAAAGDIVVVTIPYGRTNDVPAAPLAGKVVIDTGNYYPQRDGHIAALDDRHTASSVLVQGHFAQANVVKAFNNIMYKTLEALARPAGAPDRSALFIAGDDAAAKQAVTDFIETIGFDVVDTGSLADTWRYQPDQPAYNQGYPDQRPRRGADLQALLDEASA